MSENFFHKEDLIKILEFIDAFKCTNVEIKVDDSSGIGAVITATIHGQKLFDQTVSITTVISDETSW
jgi:hypothetical protein